MPFLGKQPTAGFASIVKDDLTGNGTTGPYTLSKQVANANDIAVFVGNVRQEPTDAYTVNGNQLTMTGTVSSSQNFYVLHIAGTVESSVVPAAGTTVPGAFGVSGDLTVDTNVLHVDSASNRVGMGVDPTTMPSFITHSVKTINGGGIGISSDNLSDNRYIFFGHGTASSDIQRASIKNTSSDLEFHTAAVKKMTIDSNGNITKPNNPAFIAYRSSDITLVYTNNFITYDATSRNNGSHYNTSNGRFTAPVAGVYYFFAKLNVDTTSIVENKIVVNGTEVIRTYYPHEGVNQRTSFIASLLYLNASDYVQFNCYNAASSGTNRLLGSNSLIQSHVGGYLVG